MDGALRPLLLRPVFLPKVWGAPSLPPALARLFNAPAGVGEIWLASDRHHVTTVIGGPFEGLGLDEVASRRRAELLGQGATGHFPLLAKILCVGQWLSVQVHPDDETARRLEGEPWGKSEVWRVLEAAPEAQIIHGLGHPAGPDELRRALAQGTLAGLLARVPAATGQTFAIPAGTIHATGPGLTIFEVQQASDVTYRFYDWDRPGDDGRPRALHVDKALEALRPSGPGRPEPVAPAVERPGCVSELLARMPAFSLWRRRVTQSFIPPAEGRPRVWFVLAGRGHLEADGPPRPVEPGQCWVLPALGPRPALRAMAENELIILESAAH